MRAALKAALMSSGMGGMNGIVFVGDSNTQGAVSTIGLGSGDTISMDAAGLITIVYASAKTTMTVGEPVTINWTVNHLLEKRGVVVTSTTAGCTIQTDTLGAPATDTALNGAISRLTPVAPTSARWIYLLMAALPALQVVACRAVAGTLAGSTMRNQCTLAAADPGELIYYSGGTNNSIIGLQNAATILSNIQGDIAALKNGNAKHILLATVPPLGSAVSGYAAKNAELMSVNASLADMAAADDRLHLVDINAGLILPGSTTGEGDPAKFLADGVHYYTSAGAGAVAPIVSSVLAPLVS